MAALLTFTLTRSFSSSHEPDFQTLFSRDLPLCALAALKMGYWDAEDGTDCLQKTWVPTKLGAAIGLVGSAYHLIIYQPETALQGLQRASAATLTMASLGAIFGMTTCITAQIREKPDSPLNYFAGGCASGVFLGVRTHNYMTGTTACLAFGTVAAFAKIAKMENIRIIGPPRL